jgi:Protein of unknown function (DUF2735)
MAINNSGSAKILTFPPRGRFARAIHGEQFAPAAANLQFPRGVRLVAGSSWYHDEAIQQSIKEDRDPFRKN